MTPVDEADEDEDGVRACAGDCDDANPAVGPDRAETCGNGRDDDCDGRTDAEDAACGGVPDAGADGDADDGTDAEAGSDAEADGGRDASADVPLSPGSATTGCGCVVFGRGPSVGLTALVGLALLGFPARRRR